MKKIIMMNKKSGFLSLLSSVGVIATAITSANSALKIKGIIDDYDENRIDKYSAIKKIVPQILPPIGVITGTIMCISSNRILNSSIQKSIMTGYIMTREMNNKYRNKVIERYGKEVDDEIRSEIVRTNCAYHQLNVRTPDTKKCFYDSISKREKECYEREIMDAEYHFNRNYILSGYATLNDFYTFLGLPHTKYGEKVGWCIDDGIMWVDFEHVPINLKGKKVYLISPVFTPEDLSEYDYYFAR